MHAAPMILSIRAGRLDSWIVVPLRLFLISLSRYQISDISFHRTTSCRSFYLEVSCIYNNDRLNL